MNNSTYTFGKRLKELRIKKGLNQSELGKKLGISRGAISYYESGDRVPDINVLYEISNYFNVTSDYLIGRSNNSTTDFEIQNICNKTGLSDKAVENIIKLNTQPCDGHGEKSLMFGLDYLLSHTLTVDIMNGREPDNDYWESVKEKECKGSFAGGAKGELKCIFYYGKGIDFLRKLNNILFNNYVDFNPYSIVGRSVDIIKVIDKKNTFETSSSFSLLDTNGQQHSFDLSIITKATLLELNDLLTEIRDTIKREPPKEFVIEFDEEVNYYYGLEKKRQQDYLNSNG